MEDSVFCIESIWFTENSDKLIADIVNSSGPVILYMVTENVPLPLWISRLTNITTQIKNKDASRPVILFINSVYKPYLELKQINSIDDVVFIDFFLLLVYYRLIVCKESTLVTEWSPNNKQFLFLTGKNNKIQRIRLLYKFYIQKMLPNIVWSLFLPAIDVKNSNLFIPELSDAEYKKFLVDHTRNPDNIDIISTTATHYSGIPYDSIIYKNCDFQVVSETDFADIGWQHAWITEKTWLAIINRRPFIIAGNVGTLKKLQNLGFKTFEQYLKIPNYDSLTNDEERLDAIVCNSKDWLDTITNFYNEITHDLEHNFNKMLELSALNFVTIQQIINKYKLKSTKETLLPLVDQLQHAQWKNWYERVRDSNWPDCEKEENFDQLPTWIQTELIEVFNYTPKKKYDYRA